jgi:hypothetical protein
MQHISGALFPRHEVGINLQETTIAEMLKEKGKETGNLCCLTIGGLITLYPVMTGRGTTN